MRSYLKKRARIDWLAMEANFEMQVRAGGAAGASDRPDHLAGADDLADARPERGHMSVARLEAIAMIDVDGIAVASATANECDFAVGG